MGRPTSKKQIGLGKSLLNDTQRTKAKQQSHLQSGIRSGADSDEPGVKLRSVTQERALDEFLSTAALANTDFTAEKTTSVRIITNDGLNPYLLSPEAERKRKEKQQEFEQSLTVPRRPLWNEQTTRTELDRNEKDAFLEWRRHLAELQEHHDLLLTPFERNLEVWRQLWRVIERSDLIVQIVDARNPLLFRSTDLEAYVKELGVEKRNLLLVNKADMLTLEQRRHWAEYFVANGIRFSFFSAALAKEENERDDDRPQSDSRSEDEIDNDGNEDEYEEEIDNEEQDADYGHDEEEKSDELGMIDADDRSSDVPSEDSSSERRHALPHRSHLSDKGEHRGEEEEERELRILKVDELEELFLSETRLLQTGPDETSTKKASIGLVGYPNVGKSSTINALIGAKKVSVSATPGKTKHFQTIALSDRVTLVDCPGLVFPNFASTEAELVCNGILPIDQLREYTGPTSLVCRRIPRAFLEGIYGFRISVLPVEEGGDGVPTGEELLRAYALSRGFTKAGQGNPDESRAARYVLKDYVSGKLLYCEPPPDDAISGSDFNQEHWALERLPFKKAAPISHVPANASTFVSSGTGQTKMDLQFFTNRPGVGAKIRGNQELAAKTLGTINGKVIVYPFQQRLNDDGTVKGSQIPAGKMLSGRKAREMAAIDRGLNPDEQAATKKHFKMKRSKNRPLMN